ncbi:MAG: hypothetical protein GX616_02260 [Planctomycetes bacterium]|nr:hypothetical protein [Planctomycetota bacterium]
MADSKPKAENTGEITPEIRAMVDAMVEAALAKKENERPTATKQRNRAEADRMNELVEVRLFKDNNEYKDPVFVSINGKNMVIERGVTVKIPRNYALVLEQSHEQGIAAANYEEARQNEYAEDTRRVLGTK